MNIEFVIALCIIVFVFVFSSWRSGEKKTIKNCRDRLEQSDEHISELMVELGKANEEIVRLRHPFGS